MGMNYQGKDTIVSVGAVALGVGVILGLVGARFHNRAAAVPRLVANTEVTSVKTPAVTQLSQGPGSSTVWNAFQEIRNMQAQMDQLYNEMFNQLDTGSSTTCFKPNPVYSVSLQLQDLKNRYEVRAFMPDSKSANANVSLQGNRTLKVEVNTESENKAKTVAGVTRWGSYEQTLQLPAPVDTKQMKIERKDHELLITLPKATG